MMTTQAITGFCSRWLPCWTGNQPEKLLEFYTEDAFYCDPTAKQGLRGKALILAYFKKLLRYNPDWRWAQEEVMPIEKGFTLKWRAEIPVGGKIIVEYGLDIVEMHNGLISRNEVYFDTLALITAIKSLKS